MNIKVMVLIVIILLVAVVAIQLFVPKNVDLTTGKISTFKKNDSDTSTNQTTATTAAETV